MGSVSVPGISVQVWDKSLYEIAKELTTDARDRVIRVELAKMIKNSDIWGPWTVLVPEHDGLDDNTLKALLHANNKSEELAIHLMNCSVNIENSAAFADMIRPDTDGFDKRFSCASGGRAEDKLRYALASKLKQPDSEGISIVDAFDDLRLEVLFHKFGVNRLKAIAAFCEARSVWVTEKNFRYEVADQDYISVTDYESQTMYKWQPGKNSDHLNRDSRLAPNIRSAIKSDIQEHSRFRFVMNGDLKDILFTYECSKQITEDEPMTIDDTFISRYIRDNVSKLDDFFGFMAELREKIYHFQLVLNDAWGRAKAMIESSGDLLFTQEEIKTYIQQKQKDRKIVEAISRRATKTWKAMEIFRKSFDPDHLASILTSRAGARASQGLLSDRQSAGLYQAFLSRRSPNTSNLRTLLLRKVQEGSLLYRNSEDQGADEVWLRRLLTLKARSQREAINDRTKAELIDSPDCFVFKEPISQTLTVLYKGTILYDREGYVESAQNIYSDHQSLSELLAAVLSTAIKVHPVDRGEVEFENGVLEHFVSQSRFGAYAILYNADVHVKDRLVRESEIWKLNPPSWAKLRAKIEILLNRMQDIDKNWVIREVFSRLVINGVAVVDPISRTHTLSCFASSLKECYSEGEITISMDSTVPLQGVKAQKAEESGAVVIRLRRPVKVKAETQGKSERHYLNVRYYDRVRVHLSPGTGMTPKSLKNMVMGHTEAGIFKAAGAPN